MLKAFIGALEPTEEKAVKPKPDYNTLGFFEKLWRADEYLADIRAEMSKRPPPKSAEDLREEQRMAEISRQASEETSRRTAEQTKSCHESTAKLLEECRLAAK